MNKRRLMFSLPPRSSRVFSKLKNAFLLESDKQVVELAIKKAHWKVCGMKNLDIPKRRRTRKRHSIYTKPRKLEREFVVIIDEQSNELYKELLGSFGSKTDRQAMISIFEHIRWFFRRSG